jgi:phosphatidylserine decarboxylase
MKNRFDLAYYDRAQGGLVAERVFAAGFLYWSYNTRLGRAVTRWVLSRRAVSRACGWLMRRSWSRHLIGPFERATMADAPADPRHAPAYACFNDFFVRDREGISEHTVRGASTCASPVDGKLFALCGIGARETFRVKRSLFNLEKLLGDRQLGERFAGGTALICRLGLCDYHHFHFPCSGVPQPAFAVAGRLYAGGPYALRTPTSFYAENFRMVTLIDSDRFGQVAQVEIGAFTVGSIRQHFRPGRRAHKGEKKGYFELGGSTVVLVFAAGAIEIDGDLRRHSDRGFETRLRVGDSVGRVPRPAAPGSGPACGRRP